MADKEMTERRVHVLPVELLERIRAYQASQNIGSEVEAVRRLLDSALQMRDSVEDILMTLAAKFVDEKDLRVLARDVLTNHALVTEIKINDSDIIFRLRSGYQGQLRSDGYLFKGDPSDSPDYFSQYRHKAPLARDVAPKAAASVGWDSGAPRTSDLDDEIPF